MIDHAVEVTRVKQKLATLLSTDRADDVVAFVHEGDPVPKARARSTKTGGHYTPAKTRKGEQDLAWMFRSALAVRPIYTNVAMFIEFYLSDRRRIDLDNLEKLVFDAATKAHIWQDDCQLTMHASVIGLDQTHPRTVVAFCPTSGSLDRTVPTKRRARLTLPFAERIG